ncbi:ATPase [Robbsia sp. KACC 23696]|uniref:ATPase n=1 Tax=Robbsia sp. KACC 23696 TaxID=3149231 RepID=UPI00325BF0ED
MLNELDSLSEKITRLLRLVDNNRQTQADRDAQLNRMRVERDEALTASHALRADRDALRQERDALLAKIEDAQIKLNAILEKLPTPRDRGGVQHANDDGLNQAGDAHHPNHHEATGAEALAEQEPHVEGESYGR